MRTSFESLKSIRRSPDRGRAVFRHPEYDAALKTHAEVVSLIRPLAKNVAPSRACRESIRARLLELWDSSRRAA